MTRKFQKPRVVISKCVEFEKCRWNGVMISSESVRNLKSLVNFIPVCPECEIGLGVPRKPIRVVKSGDTHRLIQSETDSDYTEKMESFSKRFIDGLEDIDGFILKERSPSCGTRDVKIYPSTGRVSPISSKGAGFFGRAVMDGLPFAALENEGRLENMHLREHFYTRIFTFSEYRKTRNSRSMKDLVAFHTRHKFLLMGYNQQAMRFMGKIVANHEKYPIDRVLFDYEKKLKSVFYRQPRFVSNINVLMHIMGYFKDRVTSREKSFFLDLLDQYRSGTTTLSVCTALLRSWIIRFEDEYLKGQSYFQPFPEDLVDIRTSGKPGRGPERIMPL